MRKFLHTFCVISCLMVLVEPAKAQETSPKEEPAPSDSDEGTQVPTEEEDQSRIVDLPLLQDMKIPTMKELLHGEPVTWLIVVQDRVVVSRPINPRPNTLESLAARLEELRAQKAEVDPKKRAAQLRERKKYQYIRGGFPGAEVNPEFLIATENVRAVWHHEDLMLKRAELLMKDNNLADAFELVFALERINPNWPGLRETHERVLFLDGMQFLKDGKLQASLARFEELFQRNPDYPELSQQIGNVTNQLIERAEKANQFRRARHFLHRLEARIPNHQVVQLWTGRFQLRADELVQKSILKESERELSAGVALLREASAIWPYGSNLKLETRRQGERYQVLYAGVLVPAGKHHPYPLTLDADERNRRLTEHPLFEVDYIDDTPHYRTGWFDHWEPTELGRQLEFDFRTVFDYWDSRKPLSAALVAKRLGRKLDRDSSEFDERLSGFVSRIHASSPTDLTIEFSRAPLRVESLFRAISLSSSDGNPAPFFVEHDRGEQFASFRRAVAEPNDVKFYHVAEVHEHAYADRDELMRGLLRGEIDFIPDASLATLDQFENHPNWIIRQYALPKTHLLQFHPDSLPARNQELRRALLYTLDRDQLLKESGLAGGSSEFGRLVSSPFPSQSYATTPVVEDIVPDLRVGLSLALAAKKQNEGKLPVMKMVVPPDDQIEAVVGQMIEAWYRVGINVEVITDPAEQGGWDIAYRTISMEEPLAELWPLLTLKQQARVSDLQLLPGWLRQQLINLDLATNWEDSVELLHRIHLDLWGEVFLIPLWEIDRFMLMRRNIQNVPERPVHSYDGLERWVAHPWFDERKP